jgi:UDP-2-acetamido-3-amino-2,3-dideoxy-glucuronate N-acetyltransferase
MQYIDPSAVIGEDVTIGEFTVIHNDVIIGDNSVIGSHVVIHPGTRIGRGVRIDDGTVIGKKPMRSVRSALKESTDLPAAQIGDECIIGTMAIIYRGSRIDDRVLVADLATIRENTRIGAETIIGRGTAVENHCTIGKRCKLETNAYITAYSCLEDDVFVAPGVVTSNDNFAGRSRERFRHFKGVTIKRGGRIGAQATVLPGRVIEEDGMAGAGSVVTRDVKARKVYVGNPARELKDVPPEQLLENQNT